MTTMHDEAFVLDSVKDAYSAVATTGSTVEYASAVAQSFGYSIEQLESIPLESHMGLGCGNPTVTATLKPGETVLDLGSGGGIDIFLAASKIGPHGKAIGLDMSGEMIKRARQNATKRGLFPPHVSFVECSLTEALPITSNSVDCVLSNCVINLLPPLGKNHIFREVYRVLKPEGRLVLDDILAKTELPTHIRNNMAHYVSCIGGAVQVHEYLQLLRSAGFNDAVFVDSRADLNIYVTAAEAGSGSAASQGCCTPTTTLIPPPDDRSELDLNQWAASYQIYTTKPHDASAVLSGSPLLRWWDAFPAVRALDIARITPVELAKMLRKDGTRIAVIDVRENNETRTGRIAGSRTFPAHEFHPGLAAFHELFKAMESVVFYCSGSAGRAPRCGGWCLDGMVGPDVFVLDGEMKAWLAMAESSGDWDLVASD
ncbi:S-adenosyl-L-methionine-dependent methyltransferase [Mycena filopes]|nr:S-adenosyl-L-methionine-dependent methyltransferase [Mycena filopes]